MLRRFALLRARKLNHLQIEASGNVNVVNDITVVYELLQALTGSTFPCISKTKYYD